MREIKFRGKPITSMIEDDESYQCIDKAIERAGYDGSFVYGMLVYDGKKPFIVGEVLESNEDYITLEYWIPVMPETVGQFTGLTDKNGKEIYEGDIVDYYYGFKSEIKFMFGSWFVVANENLYDRFDSLCAKLEVIGNIHDNPELMKGETK